MSFDPARAIFDQHVFGEFGEVNPSISDGTTYTFLDPQTLEEHFAHGVEGCFLYSRQSSPSNQHLASALAAMEDTEAAQVTASGMGAITAVLMQCCAAGDEVIADRTVYGGTYAFLKNFAPRYGIVVHFVDLKDLAAVRAVFSDRTKVVYGESMSNPLLEVPDIPALAEITRENQARLVIDNTFAPLLMCPARLGADVVVHSLTKFTNGMSDGLGGAVCGDSDFLEQLSDVHSGALMLFGPTMDGHRSASILKNLHTLPARMQKHSENAEYIARRLDENGLDVRYPGLSRHPQHDQMTRDMNPRSGYGGMLALDVGSGETARQVCRHLQEEQVGYLAVSLGYFRTLFSPSGSSTSSEIPEDEQRAMGLTDGLIRFSIGLDADIENSWARMKKALSATGLI